MSPILIAATTIISLALIAYTIGVFGERNSGTLKRSHLIFFWIGLACDSTGTAIMSSIAQSSGGSISLLHPVTGGLAIALMLFHATWATYVLLRGDSKQRHNFHRLSICVWLIWLVPYCTGVLIGIPALHVADGTALAIASAIVVVLAVLVLPKKKQALRCKTQRQRAGGDRLATARRLPPPQRREAADRWRNDGSHHNARCQQQIGETNP